MGIVKKIDQMINGKWEVRKLIWPYPEGYGTFHTGKRTLLDTVKTREEAQRLCDEYNNPRPGTK